jgi:hypothetical protein
MKYLMKYDMVTEADKWIGRAIKSAEDRGEFNREEDIKMYLIEMCDMSWVLNNITHHIKDEDFNLKGRINYLGGGLYHQYLFEFTNTKILTMDRTIELLESLTSAVDLNNVKSYFVDLFDLGWRLSNTEFGICDEDFELLDQVEYIHEPLYIKYTITLTYHKTHSMSTLIEILGSLTSSFERMKDDGYLVDLIDMTLGKTQKGNKKVIIQIYNTKNVVPFEIIFPKKPKKPKEEVGQLKPKFKKSNLIPARPNNPPQQPQS